MALTEEQIEIMEEAMLPLFNYLEKEVIADVARRIKKTTTYTRTAELQAMSMKELGFSPAKIRAQAMKMLGADPKYRKEVAKNTLEYKKAIKDLIAEIVKKAIAANDKIIGNAGEMSWIDDLRVWKQNGVTLTDKSFLPRLIDTYKAQTAGTLKNLTNTTGFKTLSGYEAIQSLYTQELDKAIIKLTTGTFDQETVLKSVIHDLSKSGIRSIDYASGRSFQLDTAARMCLRTGCNQLAAKVSDKNMNKTGVNLVYVSKHWGARNEGTGHANHEQWQGKVYYYGEYLKEYKEEAERIGQEKIEELYEVTGYSVDGSQPNDVQGLHGVNCRHQHHPWFIGGSTLPAETPEPAAVMYKGKKYDYYAVTQKMRAMERDIRALKREKEARISLGMDISDLNPKISGKTKEYNEFCFLAKVNPQPNRLRYECGTSNLKKTEAWKNHEKLKEEKVSSAKKLTDEDIASKVGGKVDFSAMNNRVADEYRTAISDYYDQYPALKGYVNEFNTKITTFAARGESVVEWEYQGAKPEIRTRISFTPYKEYDTYLKDVKNGYEDKSLFENDNATANANHELTHSLQQLLVYSEKGLYQDGKFAEFSILDNLSKKLDIITDSNKIVKAALKKVGGKNYNFHELTDYLGTYAQSNNTEMIAQAMAYEMSGRTNPFSAEIKRLMDERYEKLFGYNPGTTIENTRINGTIKSLDVDDFHMMASAHEITGEVSSVISGVIREFEAKGDMYIADFHFGDFRDAETGNKALFQIFQNAHGMTELNINSTILGGRTVKEIDEIIANTHVNLPVNLTEAVVHECGHAKAYFRKSASQVEEMNKALKTKGIGGISKIAEVDGAECIAEIEVLIYRGKKVPHDTMELYREYVKGAGK